jgi:RNA polymerase sigma-70 factor (ECF subfamily)
LKEGLVVPDAAAAEEQLEVERRQVAEAQQGNLDAMRPVFERYAAPLYGSVILPRTGDAATAEDVLRDTFATAIEKLHTFQWTGRSIYAWLRQIALNKVYDVHRQTRRSQHLVEALAVELPAETAPESRADAQLMAQEERSLHRERIDQTLARIHPRYRLAIELRLIRELPREQCAAELDVTTATFDVILFRAVRAFRKQFGARHAITDPGTSPPTDTSPPDTTPPGVDPPGKRPSDPSGTGAGKSSPGGKPAEGTGRR